MLRSFLISIFFVALSLGTAYAGCYTCTVNQVNADVLVLTDAGGAFSKTHFSFPEATSTRNQYLAIALTAISSGKTVGACMSSVAEFSTLTAIAIKE